MLACAAFCASTMPASATWYLQVDNDVVFTTDRWYTSGVRLAKVAADAGGAMEWGILQEIYTPEARYYERGRTDRVPAGRLVGYFAKHRLAQGSLQTLEVQLGVRGPAALGEQATDLVHQLVPSRDIDWSREEGNQVDASATFSRSQPLGAFVMHYGAVLGTQVALAHAGVELRVGPAGARRVLSPLLRFAATPPIASAGTESGWNAFIGVSGRAVLRNDLLGRSYGVGEPDLSVHRSVGRFATGVAWSNAWARVTFSVAQDTREFERQRTAHKFGSLTASIDF